MRTHILFSGLLPIDYGQFSVDPMDPDAMDLLEPGSAHKGQTNGLCGAAQEGKLFFVAGPQNGVIAIQVELHDSEPSIDPNYGDIVEAHIRVGDKPLYLCEWDLGSKHKIDIPPGLYRVRYSVQGLDLDYKDVDDGQRPIEGQCYLLQFWPGDGEGDKIVKLGSKVAEYWHREWGGNADV